MKKENIENLYKKMDATSKTRFASSQRLKLHSILSTYTIVSISTVLIGISLMQAYKIGNNIDAKEVALI